MERSQGRPIGSKVRQNMIEILYFYKALHGYELSRVYCELYTGVSMRLIYYHLKKGLDINEFKIKKIEKKSGHYSWGQNTENIIYELGPAANPLVEPRIKIHMENSQRDKDKATKK